MTTKRTPADGTSEIVANDFNADVPAGSNFVFTVDKPVGLLAPRGRDRQEVGYLLPSGLKVIVKSGESYTTMSFSGQHAVNIPQVRLMDNESAEFFATYVPLAPAHRAVQTPITIMVFECTCGRDRCEELHRIENWKSNQQVMKHNGQKIPLSLRSFIASAVIGPLRKLKPGSIVEGMYFAFLTREFGIRKGTVGQVASGGHGFEIHNARIVVPPAYVCRKLCICTNNGCRHGFDYPTIQQIKHANKCTNCDKPLLGLGHLLNGNNDLLTIARYIQDWQWDNQQNGRCNICNRPIKMWIWCPRCRATTNSGIQTLPRRESIVWILIF